MTGARRGLVAALLILGLFGLGPALAPGAPRTPAPNGSDFEGKIVILTYGRGDAQTSAALEKASVKRLGDRQFIVGVGVDEWTSDKWAHGLTVWIPVDNVTSIVEVADMEHAKKVFGNVAR
ncbi:MAG TPA: hypothetical protein VKD90_28495 [Gemmataceae bacterium]|nr:hypothetical protein [Gemmataceae bacterium]